MSGSGKNGSCRVSLAHSASKPIASAARAYEGTSFKSMLKPILASNFMPGVFPDPQSEIVNPKSRLPLRQFVEFLLFVLAQRDVQRAGNFIPLLDCVCADDRRRDQRIGQQPGPRHLRDRLAARPTPFMQGIDF